MNRILLAAWMILSVVLLTACDPAASTPDAPVDANAQAVAMTLTAVELAQQATDDMPQSQATAPPPTPSPFIRATAFIPPTAIRPATLPALPSPTPNLMVNNTDRLLTSGRGLTTGRSMSNGEFEVEGYCNILNPEYGVREDGQNWYCTYQGEIALTLRQSNYDDICRRTYGNGNAFALQIGGSQPAAYRWRCVETVNQPSPTPQLVPYLLLNGTGLSTGRTVTNGEFEVEGYCSALNSAYGVNTDSERWYCTLNGQRVLTLGTAEFDDICFRTYRNPGAYAQQINNNEPPAYRWRCYVLR